MPLTSIYGEKTTYSNHSHPTKLINYVNKTINWFHLRSHKQEHRVNERKKMKINFIFNVLFYKLVDHLNSHYFFFLLMRSVWLINNRCMCLGEFTHEKEATSTVLKKEDEWKIMPFLHSFPSSWIVPVLLLLLIFQMSNTIFVGNVLNSGVFGCKVSQCRMCARLYKCIRKFFFFSFSHTHTLVLPSFVGPLRHCIAFKSFKRSFFASTVQCDELKYKPLLMFPLSLSKYQVCAVKSTCASCTQL